MSEAGSAMEGAAEPFLLARAAGSAVGGIVDLLDPQECVSRRHHDHGERAKMWPGGGHGKPVSRGAAFHAEGFRRCRMNAHHLTPLRAGPTSFLRSWTTSQSFQCAILILVPGATKFCRRIAQFY